MESNRKNPENTLNENNKPIETDSAEIVRRHLEDENHEITDEDIRNVKVITLIPMLNQLPHGMYLVTSFKD
jgi:hypothetical protein